MPLVNGHPSQSRPSPVNPPPPQNQPAIISGDVHQRIIGLPKKVILHSLTVFIRKVPELAFLHTPHFMANWSTAAPEETVVLFAAILAFIKGNSTVQDATWFAELLSADEYAAFARGFLQRAPFLRPKIHIVQALLVMSLYDWGNRHFHRAWVFCGKDRVLLVKVRPLIALKGWQYGSCKRCTEHTLHRIYPRTYLRPTATCHVP